MQGKGREKVHYVSGRGWEEKSTKRGQLSGARPRGGEEKRDEDSGRPWTATMNYFLEKTIESTHRKGR